MTTTTDLDTLLTQALALASEDKRGELAAVMEQIVDASSRDVLAAIQAEVEMERAYIGEIEQAAYATSLLEELADKIRRARRNAESEV